MSKINVLLWMFIVLNFIARTVVLLKNTIYKLFHRPIADKIEIKVKLEVTLTSKMTMAIELVSFFVVSRNLLGAVQPTIPENQPIINTKNRLL